MAKSSKGVMKKFDCFITAVAMDQRFLLSGMADGNVVALYWNGATLFQSEVSDTAITAVACEKDDDGGQDIFYAADDNGKLYSLNKKGKVIATGKGRDESIHTLLPQSGLGNIAAWSATGFSIFQNAHKEIKVALRSGTGTAQFSLDGDGEFYRNKSGQYHVNRYNCSAPTTAIATCRLQLGDGSKGNEDRAFAVVDPQYVEDLKNVESNKLPVYISDTKLIRTLTFSDPVIQVMSRRYTTSDKADEIYFLLRNGEIVKMKGSKILNTKIKNEDLVEKLEIDLSDLPDGDGDSDSDDDDDGDSSVGTGFVVHGSSKGAKFLFKGRKAIVAVTYK